MCGRTTRSIPIGGHWDVLRSSSGAETRCESALQKLHVCKGRAIGDPEEVATFLKTLFPKLDTLWMDFIGRRHGDASATTAGLSGLKAAWWRVRELVPIIPASHDTDTSQKLHRNSDKT